MGVTMKQIIGLWGVNYQDVAEYLGYKHKSTIEKRIKNGSWHHHEVVAILIKVKQETGVEISSDNVVM